MDLVAAVRGSTISEKNAPLASDEGLDEHIVLVQNVTKGIHESKVNEKFTTCGNVLWTSTISPGCMLVRFQARESASKAVQQLDKQQWHGQKLVVTPYRTISTGNDETKPNIPGNLAETIIAHEHAAGSGDFRLSALGAKLAGAGSNVSSLPADEDDLIPSSMAWSQASLSAEDPMMVRPLSGSASRENTSGSMDFEAMLNYSPARSAGGIGAMDEAWDRLSVHSGTSSSEPNTHTLFSQRSIGTTARHDLARMAAMASMAGMGAPSGMQGAANQWGAPGMMAPMGGMNMMGQMPYLGRSTGGHGQPGEAMMHGGPPGADFAPGLRLPDSALRRPESPSMAPPPGIFTGLDEQTLNVLQQLVGGQGQAHRAHSPSSQPTTPLAPPSTPSAYQLPSMHLPQIRTMHDGRAPPHQHQHQHQHQHPHQNQHHHAYPNGAGRNNRHNNGGHRMRPHSPAAHGYHAQPNTPNSPNSPRHGRHGNQAHSSQEQGNQASQPELLLQLLQGLAAAPGSPLASPGGSPMAAPHQNSAFNRLLAAGNAGMDAPSLMSALQNIIAGGKPGSIIPDAASPTPNVTPTHAAAGAVAPGYTSRLGRSRLSSAGGPCSSPTPACTPTVAGSGGNVQQEFAAAKAQLVQLMTSAHAFVTSDTLSGFFEKLAPVATIYDAMHDLPVVQKRRSCEEMAGLRAELVADSGFVSILQAASALRDHVYSLSRKVLLMSHSMDGVPIDLFLGSMASETGHLVRPALAPEAAEFFTNSLPHAKLALLVFAEFVPVDPAPVVISLDGSAAVGEVPGEGRGSPSAAAASGR